MADLISRAAAIEEIKPIRYCGDFISALIHLPAVDAVPVEWIQKFCEDDIAEDQRETIEWMLKVWKREQGARM